MADAQYLQERLDPPPQLLFPILGLAGRRVRAGGRATRTVHDPPGNPHIALDQAPQLHVIYPRSSAHPRVVLWQESINSHPWTWDTAAR